MVFYLRVITDKPDINEKVLKKRKEPEEVMTIKETHRVIP